MARHWISPVSEESQKLLSEAELRYYKGIATYIYGPEDADLTIFFVHGFTLTAESFYFQILHLLKECSRIRIVLIDLRGHGASKEVEIQEYSIQAAANDLIGIIEFEVRGKLLLVGHSLGVSVILAALRQPEVRNRTVAALLMSGSAREVASRGIPRLLNLRIARLLVFLMGKWPEFFQCFREILVEKIMYPILAAGVFIRSTAAGVIKLHARLINETSIETMVGFMDDLRIHNEEETVVHLGDLPGYVMVGVSDHFVPTAQSEHLARSWKGSYLQFVPEAGHMIPLEASPRVNLALDRLIEYVS